MSASLGSVRHTRALFDFYQRMSMTMLITIDLFSGLVSVVLVLIIAVSCFASYFAIGSREPARDRMIESAFFPGEKTRQWILWPFTPVQREIGSEVMRE